MQRSGVYDTIKLPLVYGGLTFYRDSFSGGLIAATETSNRPMWKSEQLGHPQLIEDVTVFAWSDADEVHLVDPTSGTPRRIIPCPIAQEAVVDGDILVLRSITDELSEELIGVSVSSGTQLWKMSVGGKQRRFMGTFCVANGYLLIGHGDPDFSSHEQEVVAIDIQNGREVWRHRVADLTWDDVGNVRCGQARGVLAAKDDVVVITVLQHYVVGLSLHDGRRLWTWKTPHGAVWQGYPYGNRYYVIAGFGTYHVVDVRTGGVLFEADLRQSMPSNLRRFNPHSPLLVSETHVFTGSLGPYLLAFERDTGRFAWSHKPKGAGDSQGAYFVSTNGRLYYGDGAMQQYCLEEVEPTDPVLTEQRCKGRLLGGW